jgi:hypothetical protein
MTLDTSGTLTLTGGGTVAERIKVSRGSDDTTMHCYLGYASLIQERSSAPVASSGGFSISIRGNNGTVSPAKFTNTGVYITGDSNAICEITPITNTHAAYSRYYNAGNDLYIGIDRSTATTFGSAAYEGNIISTLKMNIRAGTSGGVGLAANATSWSSWSDETLKVMSEWEPIENALAKLTNVRSGISRYITDDTNKRRAFLIAQDWATILPEAVEVEQNGKLSLRYVETIPLLVKAIQELTTKNSLLEARLAAIEGAK